MRIFLVTSFLLFGPLAFAFQGPASGIRHFRGVSNYEACDVTLSFSKDGKVSRIEASGMFNRYSHVIDKFYQSNESKSFDVRGLHIEPITGFAKGFLPINYGEIIGNVNENDRQAMLYTNENGELWSMEFIYDEFFSNAIFQCEGLTEVR
jgi:hypothetical protein